MDKKKKKIIIAVSANILAMIFIIRLFISPGKEQIALSAGQELQQRFIPLIEKSDFFEGARVTLTPTNILQKKLKLQVWQLLLSYTIEGDKEITKLTLQVEGKFVDGKFIPSLVNQGYSYSDGEVQWIKFNPSKHSELLLK